MDLCSKRSVKSVLCAFYFTIRSYFGYGYFCTDILPFQRAFI